MRDPLFIFEKNGKQQAIVLNLEAERKLLALGWKQVATIDPLAYLMYQINKNGMRVEE